MLKSRLYSSLIGIPILILFIWFGVNTTAALVAAAAVIGTYEFHRLTMRSGGTPIFLLGAIAAVLFTIEAATSNSPDFRGALLTGVILVPLFTLLFMPPKERLLADWAWTLAGVLFVGWTLSHAVLLRDVEPRGREWLLTAVILVFAVDTSAYMIGRFLGKHPMAPSISPAKTWEGAIGAFLVAFPASAAITAGFDLGTTPAQVILLGALVGIFAQAGDLVESMLKRVAGAKDAGELIPGHGGILDRLDSLIPGVAVVYYFVIYAL